MFRALLLLFLCTERSSSAPQQSSIETIADVKPTIFDLPSTVYDGDPLLDSPSESRITNAEPSPSLDLSSDNIQNDITTENNEGETTEYADEVTDRSERVTEFISPTVENDSRKKTPSPSYYSKLSYFVKPSYEVHQKEDPSTINLIERAGRRNYRSKCRCEKIWNCPKLQITVPRCPDEYFMCCF